MPAGFFYLREDAFINEDGPVIWNPVSAAGGESKVETATALAVCYNREQKIQEIGFKCLSSI